MAHARPFRPLRRVLSAGAVIVAASTAPALPAAAASGPAGAGTGSAAQLASAQAAAGRVDTRIAALAGQLEAAQAQVTASDMAETRLQNRLDLARADAGALLAEAYVDVSPDSDTQVPGPYLDAARGVLYSALDHYQKALAQVQADQAVARTGLSRLEAVESQLADQKQSLDAIVGADQAAQERAEAADAAALAASDSARATASNQLGPISLAATEAQQKVMAAHPFGPLPAGTRPAGLTGTSTTVSGIASWYGPGFDGRPTATGAVYDEDEWTVASPWLPLGSFLVVSAGGRSVLLLVNDRGPYVAGRVLDLSHAAAEALGSTGLIQVSAQVVIPVSGS